VFAEFRYMDGAQAGESRVVPNDFATVGRHPSSDVPFDPDKALQVSVRHAAVFKQGGSFLVRDLGSSNGTFLNGKRVRGDQPLEPGDVLQLGPTGPKIEFRIVSTTPPATRGPIAPVPRTEPVLLAEDDGIPPPALPAPEETEERVAALVQRRTAPWKWLAVGVLVAALGAGGFLVRRSYRQKEESEVERQALLARVDVLLARLERTKSSVPVIDSTLRRAKADLGSLRKSVAGGDLSSEALDTLAKNVTQVTERHEPVLTAAQFNPEQAAGEAAKAVTVVVAQFKSGAVLSGSGFAARNRGDTAWIVTNRHLIEDSSGARPIELAIVFNYTGQAFRASVAAVHDSADLALLVTRIRGGVPTVAGIADPTAGKPVAMLGFPFGLDSLGNWRETGAGATTSIGTVVGVGPDQLDVDGYGTHGSSGSPLFASGGTVVGVVFGGVAGVDRKLVAVPARRIRELLNR